MYVFDIGEFSEKWQTSFLWPKISCSFEPLLSEDSNRYLAAPRVWNPNSKTAVEVFHSNLCVTHSSHNMSEMEMKKRIQTHQSINCIIGCSNAATTFSQFTRIQVVFFLCAHLVVLFLLNRRSIERNRSDTRGIYNPCAEEQMNSQFNFICWECKRMANPNYKTIQWENWYVCKITELIKVDL